MGLGPGGREKKCTAASDCQRGGVNPYLGNSVLSERNPGGQFFHLVQMQRGGAATGCSGEEEGNER